MIRCTARYGARPEGCATDVVALTRAQLNITAGRASKLVAQVI